MKPKYELRWIACALAAFLIAYALYYQCFSSRRIYFDEIGLFNPVYMYLHYGKMTYPAHGQFDSMFVHPPVHYLLVATLMKTGLSVYHAAGALSVILFIAFAAVVCLSGFPFAVQAALLFGCFLGAFVWNEALVLRPDLTLALSWITGLVALENGRREHWRSGWLACGAFFIALAFALHYIAVASILTPVIYGVWMIVNQGWKHSQRALLIMTLGASLVLLPDVFLFILPHLHDIIQRSIAEQDSASPGSAFARHREAYAVWRNAIPYWMTYRPVGTFLTEPLFRWGIPAAFLAPLLLLFQPAIRGLALASLPHLFFLLFLARHKQIGYSGYFAPEVMLYLIALGCFVLVPIFGLVERRKSRAITAFAGFIVAAGLAVAAIHDPPALAGDKVTPVRGIYDFEAARAAGRNMLGRDALVGTTSAGVWYTSGATHLYFVTPEIMYSSDVSCLDRRRYFGFFDALAADPQQSWASFNKQRISVTSSYVDGTLQLRGLFYSDKRTYYQSQASYMLYATQRPARLIAFGVRGDTVSRFEESPNASHILLNAVCPLRTPNGGELDNHKLKLDFFAVFFKPLAVEEQAETSTHQDEHAAIVSLIADREKYNRDVRPNLTQCTIRDEIQMDRTELPLSGFIADAERTDQTIHFYQSFDDLRKHAAMIPGHAGLANVAELPSVCPGKRALP